MSVVPLPPADAGRKVKQYADDLLNQKRRIKGEQDQYNALLAEAVANGLDKKALQELVKRLQMDETTRTTQDELLELYEIEYRRAG